MLGTKLKEQFPQFRYWGIHQYAPIKTTKAIVYHCVMNKSSKLQAQVQSSLWATSLYKCSAHSIDIGQGKEYWVGGVWHHIKAFGHTPFLHPRTSPYNTQTWKKSKRGEPGLRNVTHWQGGVKTDNHNLTLFQIHPLEDQLVVWGSLPFRHHKLKVV